MNIIIALVAFAVVVPSCTAKADKACCTKEVVKTGIDVLESNGFTFEVFAVVAFCGAKVMI